MGRAGFTLIELVLSTALLALVLLVALASLHFGARLWESGGRTAEHGWVKRYFTTAFHDDVSSAYPYPGRDGVLFTGTVASLSFATAKGAFPGLPWGGARLVEYSMEEGRLVLRERALPLADSGGPARSTELSREVREVRFSYLGPSGWQDEWDGARDDGLPLAVRAALYLNGGGEAEFSVPVMHGNMGREAR